MKTPCFVVLEAYVKSAYNSRNVYFGNAASHIPRLDRQELPSQSVTSHIRSFGPSHLTSIVVRANNYLSLVKLLDLAASSDEGGGYQH